MKVMTPFANDTESQAIEGLTIENGSARIVISGDLEITKDKAGLRHAKALKAVITEIVAALEAEKKLPEYADDESKPIAEVKNPFEGTD